MLTISNYSVEHVRDPFQIISGKRYEFKLNLDIPEDDDLYSPNGISARVIMKVDGDSIGMVSYDLHEGGTDKMLEFDLEDEEEVELEAFCKEHLPQDK